MGATQYCIHLQYLITRLTVSATARGLTDFIMITLGTGVGSAIVSDGRLVCGKRGLAGELGHAVVCHLGGRPCSCGKSGCLEAYCSATGVARTAREYLAAEPQRPSLLRSLDGDRITSRDPDDVRILLSDLSDADAAILGAAAMACRSF